MRVATIDIGTNSVLLLVAEQTPRGVMAVEEGATVTRLGQGVDKRRVLDPTAIARTLDCVADYADRIQSLGVDRVAVVGTSALRDASGGEVVASFVLSRLGTDLQVITGLEEARLVFLGAISGLGDAAAVGSQVAFDVGGGSTEIIRGEPQPDGSARIDFAESIDVGSVRMTERFIKTDPPTAQELDDLGRALDDQFADLPLRARDLPPIGIAGTVTSLASISLKMDVYDGARVHGHTLSRADVERIVGLLADLPLAERRRVPGLHPGRVDVIVAGGLIVQALLRRLGASDLRVSDRGLRWGLAQELFTASSQLDRA